jgi:hypothetical protein
MQAAPGLDYRYAYSTRAWRGQMNQEQADKKALIQGKPR